MKNSIAREFSWIMEDDRAQADVGDAINAELQAEKHEQPKHPTRRFIGRKTAAANAQKKAEASGHIEDGTAVQGISDVPGKNCISGS